MIKKLINKIVKFKIKNANRLSEKHFDEYGYAFLGIYKPENFEDALYYTHTRAVFYTKAPENNIINLHYWAPGENASSVVRIKVGRSFFRYNKFKNFNSILELIIYAINFNFNKVNTIFAILEDIPTSLYADEKACEQIFLALKDNRAYVAKFNSVLQNKLKLIEEYKNLTIQYGTTSIDEIGNIILSKRYSALRSKK